MAPPQPDGTIDCSFCEWRDEPGFTHTPHTTPHTHFPCPCPFRSSAPCILCSMEAAPKPLPRLRIQGSVLPVPTAGDGPNLVASTMLSSADIAHLYYWPFLLKPQSQVVMRMSAFSRKQICQPSWLQSKA